VKNIQRHDSLKQNPKELRKHMKLFVLHILKIQQLQAARMRKRLYELIWKRTVASQMADAIIEKTSISIDMNNSPVNISRLTGKLLSLMDSSEYMPNHRSGKQ
jgi:DNA topoisomerase IA